MKNKSEKRNKKKTSTTRQVVLTNAKFLLAKYGLTNITLEDIAKGYKATEEEIPCKGRSVSLGVVRKLFPKKEDILKIIFDESWDCILEAIQRCVDLKVRASEKFRRCLEEIPRKLEEDLDAVGVLIRERYPVKLGDVEKVCPKSLRCLKTLTDLVEQIAIEGNLTHPRTEARTVVHCFYGAIEQGMLDVYFHFNKPSYGNDIRKVQEARRILEAHERIRKLVDILQTMANGVLKK